MNEPIFPSARHIVAIVMVMLLGIATAACRSETGPQPVEPTPTTLLESPVLPIGVHPKDLRTGITELDPVLDALASGESSAIAARMRLLDTPCTTTDGLGGPPKCSDGKTAGTIVSVFPILESEGTYATGDDLLSLADSIDTAGLFGIFQVTGEPSVEEAYWPSGEYGVVLVGAGEVPAYTLLVEQGQIVRIIFHYDSGPEQSFDQGRGTILVPPLQ